MELLLALIIALPAILGGVAKIILAYAEVLKARKKNRS